MAAAKGSQAGKGVMVISWLLVAAPLFLLVSVACFTETLTTYSVGHGHVAALFEFTQSFNAPATSTVRVYGTFPRVVDELARELGIGEMRLSFVRGLWDFEMWGVSPLSSAALGIQLHAWLGTHGDSSVDSRWNKLLQQLAGIFCASINLVDAAQTSQPATLFSPRTDQVLRMATLPREAVCTENLTPWIKLLPCMAHAGLASLLNPLRIFDAKHTMMDVLIQHDTATVLKQRLLVVHDLYRWNSGFSWTLESLFARKVARACPAATRSSIDITLPSANTNGWQLSEQSDNAIYETTMRASYAVASSVGRDIGMQISTVLPSMLPASKLAVARFLTGAGSDGGSLVVCWRNVSNDTLRVEHFESLAWFMRLYLHTMTFTLNKQRAPPAAVKTLLVPAIDRKRPSQLELLFELAPRAEMIMSIRFERAFLQNTEYPFDPKRGFDISGAHIVYRDAEHEVRLAMPTLLLTMPTPDFTMTYNVISFTSFIISMFYSAVVHAFYRRWRVKQDSDVDPVVRVGRRLVAVPVVLAGALARAYRRMRRCVQ